MATAVVLFAAVLRLPARLPVSVASRHRPIRASAPSFESSLGAAPAVCAALQDVGSRGGSKLSAQDAAALSEMLATSNGARGFLVNWLTDETWTAADIADPPPPLVETLASTLASSSQSMVTGLMLMNVAMPAGTALTHERMGNAAAADASRRTARRASLLLRAMLPKQPALTAAAASLRNAVAAALGSDADDADPYWADFLIRWGYDHEQLELIREALDGCEA